MMTDFEGTIMRFKEKEWNFKSFLTIEKFGHFGVSLNPSTNVLSEMSVQSPPFTAMQDASGIQFILIVHLGNTTTPDSSEIASDVRVSLWLKSVPDNDPIRVHSIISILNNDGHIVLFKVGYYSGFRVGDKVVILSISRQELLKKANNYLPGGHLTFKCEIKVIAPWKDSVTVKVDPTSTAENEYASNILKTLYEEQLLSDVILKSGDKEFKCHKAVLAGRSSYFKELFALKRLDKNTDQQDSVDVTSTMNEVELKDFLDFVYLGTARNLSQTAQKLYEVACLFGRMRDLKRICEQELISKLNKGNVVDMLVFSEKFLLEDLKEAAIKYLD